MKYIALIFLLVGCGGDVCEGSDYTIDKYDICVFDSEIDRPTLERLVDRIHELYFELTSDHKSNSNLREWYRDNETIIEFTDDGLPSNAAGATNYDWSFCDGWSWWITVRPGEGYDNIVMILNHEFLHIFDHMFNGVKGELENSHGTPGYFAIDSEFESLEYRMLQLLRNEFISEQ